MTDTPNLVPDSDILICRRAGGGLHSRSTWQVLFGFYLGRKLSVEETDEILSRVNGFGPPQWEDTWEYILSLPRNENFWRGGA